MEFDREILFRGKLVYNGVWVYGGFYKEPTDDIKDGKSYIIDGSLNYAGNANHVHQETVGQFTGFFDYAGKRIFEGDILCANTGDRWENGIHSKYLQYAQVIYNPQKARFEILGKMGESHKALDQVVNKYRALLCGNIHDNKELIHGV